MNNEQKLHLERLKGYLEMFESDETSKSEISDHNFVWDVVDEAHKLVYHLEKSLEE